MENPANTNYLLIVAQIPLALAILALIPNNYFILGGLLVMWALTFRKLTLQEIALALLAGLFFCVMNYLALAQKLFAFSNPDLIQMPIYEFFMWPFYVLHTKRLFYRDSEALTEPVDKRMWLALAVYLLIFLLIQDPVTLFFAASSLLLLCLYFHHELQDRIYVLYMIFLGALIEYTGVYSGHWKYPGDPVGGIPLWFIPMWGGTGFFLYRLALPSIVRYVHP